MSTENESRILGSLFAARLEVADAPDAIPMERFFLGAAPGVRTPVLSNLIGNSPTNGRFSQLPDPIRLLCDGDCAGERAFSTGDTHLPLGWMHEEAAIGNFVATYQCRECRETRKDYAFHYHYTRSEGLFLTLYGEIPPRRITISRKLRDLLRSDSDLLNKALASEAAGLGVGALVYYRRILENQKSRIFDKVIKVAIKLGAENELVEALKRAKGERQFTSAIDSIAGGPLNAIYLDGHNPLTLLYDSISEGVHAGTDEESLASATEIRTVLGYLADQLDQALAERADVSAAVASMLDKQRKKKAGGSARQDSDKS
jgi:hypothetical protein